MITQELDRPAVPAPPASVSTAVRTCVRCIMDTTDPEIVFDEHGMCNHCTQYIATAKVLLKRDERGQRELAQIVEQMKAEGRGKAYDCVLGVSGGVDSTYAAYVLKQMGVRPLAVHMDNGWNAELAVHNIERTLKTLGVDLHTDVLDWEEFKDLQVSFLRASVPDGEIPTDHAIGAVLYRAAATHGVRHVVHGANVVTEGILPIRWTYGPGDWRYIRSVHARFGRVKLRTFPHYGYTSLYYYVGVRRMRQIRLLDFVPYVKEDAKALLERELGWRDYGGKHHESIYTRFFQGYILPKKFGIDKRKAHLSTLICSGQVTREQALEEMQTEPYPADLQAQDREYVVKKLGLTQAEFDAIMALPVKVFRDYPNSVVRHRRLLALARLARKLKVLPGRVSR
jgi:N-acetyl sugar amidotransferase